MIHDWDTHFWMARIPDEPWISAEECSSDDPRFQRADLVRIEPLNVLSVQATLEAEIQDGYTMFLRTDRIMAITIGAGEPINNAPDIIYVMALERGEWAEPGKVPLSSIPMKDGFRAELRIFKDGHGEVDFTSTNNFISEVENMNGLDTYIFKQVV
jgi:hypothetical protein